ncbi:peptidylprolyl isomerase [Caulobacter segnis]|uniref:Peptidyl-prolyl cis-trans isomerase n=2 Tax=Caulobacter segnis TaxID=88688 RepID=D5VKP7_CAUST|nr:peptidylprolyl isomerase [Caulobacter segnis]ADG11070.1 peptidyl-prolyl cis-trans isomerase cyclophilin type [Caulobacter segnis ATCC 21756]AVQ02758.1 peptidylprolyl isomerase [Caulobacter segnis]
MTLSRALLPCLVISVTASAAMAAASKPSEQDWRTPAADTVLVIDTNKGRVFVELTPEVAPNHVARLQELTRAGVYDGRTFFRVIDRFMAQTGDPTNTGEGGTDKPNLKAEFTFRRAADTPFVTMAAPAGLEVGYLKSLPVVSQAWSWSEMTSDHKVAAWGTYCPGVVGMARDDDNNSANSQFFLMRQPYPSLDKRYTAFGRVVSGLDVVRAIKTGEPVPAPQDQMLKVRLLSDIPENERPKVRLIDPKGPWLAAETQRLRALKGADFSVCDIDLPAEVR